MGGGGSNPFIKKICCKFCIVLEAFLQHHLIILRGRGSTVVVKIYKITDAFLEEVIPKHYMLIINEYNFYFSQKTEFFQIHRN